MAAANGDKKRSKMHGTNDTFLSSMTFASGGIMRNCDCEECEFIPVPIADAIREHKRQRILAQISRTQDRSLVARHGTISVWKLTLPVDAEPLIEFGSSHRIILIDKLSLNSGIYAIGKGVVGSSDEEKSRSKMSWTEGSACLIPENGGKAVGWVHMKDDNDSGEPVGHAVIYSIKIPPQTLEQTKEEAADSPEWVQSVMRICRSNLSSEIIVDDNGDHKTSSLSGDDACSLRKVLNELQEKDG